MKLYSLSQRVDEVFMDLEDRFSQRTFTGREIFDTLEDELSDQLYVIINGVTIFSSKLEDDNTLYTYIGVSNSDTISYYTGVVSSVEYSPFMFNTVE